MSCIATTVLRLSLLALVFTAVLRGAEDFTAFIKGGTMSHVPQRDDLGFVYRNASGTAESPYKTMKLAGCTYAHFDLWTGTTGTRHIGRVKTEALRAKNEGLKVMINFFYSDDYSNNLPAGWPSDLPSLQDQVYAYTYDCLSQLAAIGAPADMVKIGNEIDGTWRDGFLLPVGQKSSSYANFVALLKEGVAATRDFDPGIKISIHSADNSPTDNVTFYQGLINNLVDFDVIALSAYAESSYDFTVLQNNLTTLAATFSKKILVCETATNWTSTNYDSTTNRYSSSLSGHPKTQTGAYTFYARMMDMVAKTAGSKGVGVLVWPFAYTAVSGANSSGDAACFWDSTTGNAIAALQTWANPVSIGSGLAALTEPAATELINDNFNSGTVGSAPAGWTVSAPSGTTIAIADDPGSGNRSVKLGDTSTTNAGYIERTFTSAGTPLRLQFRFKTTNVTNGYAAFTLRNGSSTVATHLIVENGQLNFRASDNKSIPVAVLTANTWHDVKLVAQPGATLAYFDLYVNGVRVHSRAGFRTVTGAIDRVRLSTGGAGASDVFVDNVIVSR